MLHKRGLRGSIYALLIQDRLYAAVALFAYIFQLGPAAFVLVRSYEVEGRDSIVVVSSVDYPSSYRLCSNFVVTSFFCLPLEFYFLGYLRPVITYLHLLSAVCTHGSS